jgi:integral membrane protein (TIGR00529 family)
MVDLLKLAGVLAFILFLLRFKWNLGLVLILASALTGLLFGRAISALALDALAAVVDLLTLRLVAIVLLIMFLGEILRTTLQLEGLVRSLNNLFVDRRWLLALLPMLIGLLPVVGGAMFSAPMVEETSQGLKLSRERRTFVNYWFRHTWETIFPLYPSLILAAGLMGLPPRTLTATQWPLFLAALGGGILFGLLGVRRANPTRGDRPARRATWTLLIKSIWPIVLVLGLALLLGVDLILSLLLTVAILLLVHRQGPRRLLDMLRHMPWSTAPVIVGTMIFRRVLETTNAVEVASEALAALGVPVPVVVFAVPMTAGLLTGLAVGGFAIGLPIVLPLCGPDLVGSGYGLLAFAGGYVGLLLSPVHLCLTLTRVYFKAEWGRLYRHIVPAALLLTGVAFAVVLIK